MIIDVEAFSADELIIDFGSVSSENDENAQNKAKKGRYQKPKIIAESADDEEEEELDLDALVSSDDDDDDDFFCDDSSDEEMKLRLSEAIAHKIVNHVRNSNAMEMRTPPRAIRPLFREFARPSTASLLILFTTP